MRTNETEKRVLLHEHVLTCLLTLKNKKVVLQTFYQGILQKKSAFFHVFDPVSEHFFLQRQ